MINYVRFRTIYNSFYLHTLSLLLCEIYKDLPCIMKSHTNIKTKSEPKKPKSQIPIKGNSVDKLLVKYSVWDLTFRNFLAHS